MRCMGISRREMMQLGVGAAAGSAFLTTPGINLAQASNGPMEWGKDEPGQSIETSIKNAYKFLDQMMDAYVQGSTTRLCQSYSDQIAGGTFYSAGK